MLIFLILIISQIEAVFVFEWNNITECHVQIEDSVIKVNLTSLGQSKNLFEKNIIECTPQACIPSISMPIIICQNESTGELVIVTNNTIINTNQYAIMASYDHKYGNQIAVYDGSTITKHEYLPNQIEQTFNAIHAIPFTEIVSDLRLEGDQIRVIMNGTIFKVDTKGNLEFLSHTNSTRLSRSLPFTEIAPSNFEIGPFATIIISIIEILILVLFVLFCKVKIYRTPSGRLFFEPTPSITKKYNRLTKTNIKAELIDSPYQQP